MSLQFPLNLEFKISLFTELRAHDAHGTLLAVVKEKKFSIRDEVRVFSDEARQQQTHTIKADGMLAGALDFTAKRMITRFDGQTIGAVQAQGLRTLWAAGYEVYDQAGQQRFHIKDDVPWLSIIDLPFIADYFINPTYTVSDSSGRPVYKVKKQRSMMSRKFTIEALGNQQSTDDELLLLGMIQVILRERQRG